MIKPLYDLEIHRKNGNDMNCINDVDSAVEYGVAEGSTDVNDIGCINVLDSALG